MFWNLKATQYHETSWDKNARQWRVVNTVSGEYVADKNGQPESWDSFSDAHDVARRKSSEEA
ncbi:hypothetical protein [Streptacidiphilus cavernicola]|uniref:DUF1508 domain-containing protein n=1 Tax=Streptacidiphilus cavernicola TaxID=3342716 RepID=A0ABV6VRE5_9ACTN